MGQNKKGKVNHSENKNSLVSESLYQRQDMKQSGRRIAQSSPCLAIWPYKPYELSDPPSGRWHSIG